MFCLSCGQLVAGAYPPVPQAFQQQPAAAAPVAQSGEPSRPATPGAPIPLPAPLGVAPSDAAAVHASQVPASAPPAAQPAGTPAQPLRAVSLSFSTGDRAVVSGTAVIGRVPQAAAQNSGAQAVEVTDASRSVSRVHLTLTVSAGTVTVSDAGSGNGSSVERGGVRTPLVEGRAVTVQPGDRLWLGDVSAEIAPA